MTVWHEVRLQRKLSEAVMAVHRAKLALNRAQKEYDRLYREVVRRGRWNQKRRAARQADDCLPTRQII
jgi:hypothetical protein